MFRVAPLLLASIVIAAPAFAELVGYWPADGNTDDVSGNGNHGTAFGVSYSVGVLGQAFSFGAGDRWISTPSTLTPSQSHTISAWVNWNGHNGSDVHQAIVSWYGPAAGCGNLFLGTSRNSPEGPMRYGDGWTDVQATIPTGQWVHVAATFDSSTNTRSVYLDGVLHDSFSGCSIIHIGDMTIARQGTLDGEYWKGEIDEVKVWDHLLTPSEIANLAVPLPPPPAPPVSPPDSICETGTYSGNDWVPSGDLSIPLPVGADGLILIVHGWTRAENEFVDWETHAWVDNMKLAVTEQLEGTTEWAVVGCHWDSVFDLPTTAARDAERRGRDLGDLLTGALYAGYTKFHFIGHSAGSWFIERATEALPSSATVHTTFLDAYGRLLCTDLGRHSDWSEHYVDAPGAPFTNFQLGDNLNNTFGPYNIDVSNLASLVGVSGGHSWPRDWYLMTVQDPSDPIASGWGWIFSQEGGSMPSHAEYLRGDIEAIGGSSATTECLPPLPSGSIALSKTILQTEGQLDVALDGQSFVATTSSPAWIIDSIESEVSFDSLQIDVEFLSASDGWLSVTFDGVEVLTVDEARAAPGVREYFAPLDRQYSPGSYVLSARLDSFTAATSQVRVSNIRVLLAGGPLSVPSMRLGVLAALVSSLIVVVVLLNNRWLKNRA